MDPRDERACFLFQHPKLEEGTCQVTSLIPPKTCFAPIRSCRRQSGWVANNLVFYFSWPRIHVFSLQGTPLTPLIIGSCCIL